MGCPRPPPRAGSSLKRPAHPSTGFAPCRRRHTCPRQSSRFSGTFPWSRQRLRWDERRAGESEKSRRHRGPARRCRRRVRRSKKKGPRCRRRDANGANGIKPASGTPEAKGKRQQAAAGAFTGRDRCATASRPAPCCAGSVRALYCRPWEPLNEPRCPM